MKSLDENGRDSYLSGKKFNGKLEEKIEKEGSVIMSENSRKIRAFSPALGLFPAVDFSWASSINS